VIDDSPKDFNASYGFENWQYVRPYVDVIVAGTGFNPQIAAAHLETGWYLDFNLCSGSFAAGPNRWSNPDCADFPDAYYYSQPGHPDRPLTVSYNGRIQQRFGDPASPAMRETAATYARARSAGMHFDVIYLDDSWNPDEYRSGHGTETCWGPGNFDGGKYSCGAAPGSYAEPPWTPAYSRAAWQAGEALLAAALPFPVIFNGLGSNDGSVYPEAAIASVAASAPNVWGAMCEGCFYGFGGHNTHQYSGRILDSQLQGTMTVIRAGRNVDIQGDAADAAGKERALADQMLVYDPAHLYRSGDRCGPHSHVHACIESALAFLEPYGPYPATPADLRAPGGAYAREFAACYSRGRPLGPCAAAVNPRRDAAVPLPQSFHANYAHTLRITGDSLCACFGDSGDVAADGPPAPASLPPVSGYVLVR
jgi:hypothetical protein